MPDNLSELAAQLDALIAKDTSHNSDAKSIQEWADAWGCCYHVARRRVRAALDHDKAERVTKSIIRANGVPATVTAFRINL